MKTPLPCSDLHAASTVSPSLADRFAGIVDSICRVMAVRMAGAHRAGDGVTALLLMLLYGRLQRAVARFGRILATPGRIAAVSAGVRAPRDRAWVAAPVRMRRGVGWLLRVMAADETCRHQLCGFAQQLAYLLAEVEMLALIAASPRARRVLRPLCRALPMAMPEGLGVAPRVLAPRVRVVRAVRVQARAADRDWADGGTGGGGGLLRGGGLRVGLGSFRWRRGEGSKG